MSVWYEVKVSVTRVFAVEMPSEDENGAVDVVIEEISNEFDEIEGEKVAASDVDSLLRHTDRDKIIRL